MLIYISGAISNDPDYKRKFTDAEKKLTIQGHKVINPAFVGVVLPELSHNQYLHIDKAMIDICDAVYFLQGWGQSLGAREEWEHIKLENNSRDKEIRERGVLDRPKLIKMIYEGDNEDELGEMGISYQKGG